MGFFDSLGDAILAPITLPIKAANTVLALPGQAIHGVSSSVGAVAQAGAGVAKTYSQTVQGVAQAGAGAVTGSVGALAGAAEGIGKSLALPAALAGGAVLLVMLMKESK